MPNKIDLNADLGESFGRWQFDDSALLPLISSANIACGFHAGDACVMQQTIALCARHGVRIGAHPSLPDLQGFGRREMRISGDEAYAFCVYQIGALQAFARAAHQRVAHVKPHGALYNMAMRDAALADAIARATRDSHETGAPPLMLVGLPGSALAHAARQYGLHYLREGFADRRYTRDGTLLPRQQHGAVLHDSDEAVQQALQLISEQRVRDASGDWLHLEIDTLCVHGDGAQAAALLQKLSDALTAGGVQIAAETVPA